MASFTAIQDVGQTLVDLLQDRMGDLIDSNSIQLISPGDITANEKVRLSLFLYQITENAHLKNQEAYSANPAVQRYPPLALDLHYLLSSYPSTQIPDCSARTLEEHLVLGRAMQVLYDNAILSGNMLGGSLADDDEALRVVLLNPSLDELTKLWTVFPGKAYKLSVCYLVTPVRIDSGRAPAGTQRVVSKETGYGRPAAKRRND